MQLADAIERWALERRSTLDESDEELLRRIWAKVRSSNFASVEITELSPAEARRVMALFPHSDRSSVAQTLNSVAEWVRETGNRPRGAQLNGQQSVELNEGWIDSTVPLATPAGVVGERRVTLPQSAQAISRTTYIIGGVIAFLTLIALGVIVYFVFLA